MRPFWLLGLVLSVLLVGKPLPAQPPLPKPSATTLEGVLECFTVLHDGKAPIVVIKGPTGPQMFRLATTDDKKVKWPSIRIGSTVTLTFAADDPNLVATVTTKKEAAKDPDTTLDMQFRWVKFGELQAEKELFTADQRDGRRTAYRIPKELPITAGRGTKKLTDIKPETEMIVVMAADNRAVAAIMLLAPEQKNGTVDKLTGTITMSRLTLQDKSEFAVQGNVRLPSVLDAKGTKLPLENISRGAAITLTLTSDRKTITGATIPTVMKAGFFKASALKDGKTQLTLADNSTFPMLKEATFAGVDTKMVTSLQPNTRLKLYLTPDEKSIMHVWAEATPKKK